ncbi:hypothetical protein [Streptomyces sp. NPDC051636]|uniref:hypothetical protein n=1 Tax=Streptomyces sp. NPDC051636 TaxID=3365663 RepID=UPI0037A3BF3F
MSGMFGAAADWLEFGRPVEGEPMCVHHGPVCELGARPFDELYLLVHEAHRSAGKPVPPLDEHRPMTLAERAQYWREYEEALAEAKARNDQLEAAIRGDQPLTNNDMEES